MHTLHIESTAIPSYAEQPALVPTHLTGTEGLNHLFNYQITLKTAEHMQEVLDMAANFDPLQFIGKPLTVKIDLDNYNDDDNRAIREINGMITNITLSHREARHYVYTLTLSPWLHLATLRRNSRIFQDKTVVEILSSVLGHSANQNYPFDIKLTGNYPPLDYVTQFNETDFAFFSRLCEEWGINYFFTHTNGQHTLTLVDNMDTYQLNQFEQYQSVPFYEDNTDIDVGIEHIYHLALTHQATSGKYTTDDYDYKNSANSGIYVSKTNPLVEALAQQEVYSWNEMSSYAQPHGYHSEDIGKTLTTVRMEALRAESYKAHGQGKIRGLIPGTLFVLNNHPFNEANDKWLVTKTTLTIEEAKETSVSQLSSERDYIRCEFDVFPMTQVLRPQLRTPKPLSHGPQIAIVTTDGEQNQICTDNMGRIKVRFLWDRYSTNTNHDSCWIRVATSWAGLNSGTIYLPRKGQEVIIDFIGGNLDRPLCTGQVYNQGRVPSWQLPLNQAISGIKSAELNQSGRGNYLLMDDTANEIQTQLCSDHLNSKLSLGKVTPLPNQQNPERASKGEGFYLETEGNGTVRGDHGITITTSYRDNIGPYWKCGSMLSTFAQNLTVHKHPSITDITYTNVNIASNDLLRILTTELALKAADMQPVVDLNLNLNPSIDVSSAANVNIKSSSSTHVMSGSLLTLSSSDHTSISVGQSLISTVKDFFTIFVKTKDFIVNTMKGKVILHAQENNVEINAQKNVLINSLDHSIEVSAQKNVQVHSKVNDISLQAHKENIDLNAKKNITAIAHQNISLNASEKIILNALKHLTIECKGNEIIISSPKKVIIKGGTSESSWSSSGITHTTAGKWEQKAVSHNMTTPNAKAVITNQQEKRDSSYTPVFVPSSKDISFKYQFAGSNADLAFDVVYLFTHISETVAHDAANIFIPLAARTIFNSSNSLTSKVKNKVFVKEKVTMNPAHTKTYASQSDVPKTQI